MPERRMDTESAAFSRMFGFGIMFGWLRQPSDGGDWWTRMRSQAFGRNPRCAVSSVTRRHASSLSFDAQKNDLRLLRLGAIGLVRPQDAAGARSVVRGHARLARDRDSAHPVSALRQSETRAAGLPVRQS